MKLSTQLAGLIPLVLLAASFGPVATSVGQGNVDLAQIFRCSATDEAGAAKCVEARDLITNNCTVCHTFVPIVMQQFDAAGWTGLLDRHVQNGRVNQLSSEQIAAIHAYLSENFNGDLPPPELPPELLQTWTAF
jgi:mono/diheme cytochrome c family protein